MKTLCLLLVLTILPFFPVSAQEGYDLLYPFQGGYARGVQELKWGLLDNNLETAVPFEWDYMGELSENRRLVQKNGLYGFLNEENQIVIPPSYSLSGNFSEGLAWVRDAEGKWGYIDLEGEQLIPCQYEAANDFSCGLALVKTGGLYGYINPENELVIPAVYQEAYPFYDDRACVRIEEQYGYIDTTGSLVIPAEYELAFDFSEGSAVVKSGGYGVVDSSGAQIVAPVWEHLSASLKGGYLKSTAGGKQVFIDIAGQVCSEAYDWLGDFSEGLCPVKTESGYGYLDETFSLVIPAVWDSAGGFSDGFAPVSREGLYGYIDGEGTLVTELVYAECAAVSEGFGAVLEPEAGWRFITPEETDTSFEELSGERALVLRIGHDIMRSGNEEIRLETPPILYEDCTMLPIRQVVEALGGQVDWHSEEQKIFVSYETHSVTMTLGQPGAFADGRFALLQVPPMIRDDRTLVPLRFVAEALGCQVHWEPATREILVTYT